MQVMRVFLSVFMYFERDSMSGGGVERERKKILSRLHAVPDAGLKLSKPRDHDLSQNQE